MKKTTILFTALSLAACSTSKQELIDRQVVVYRNHPVVSTFDELSSLTVGNGEFAFTVDATGLQTFPALYTNGVPLGTQSQWGWHSFPNMEDYKPEETFKIYNFHGWDEPYATQFNEAGRPHDAANYFRVNPHRMHLGILGFDMTMPDGASLLPEQISQIKQTQRLWDGIIESNFAINNVPVSVQTACNPTGDQIGVNISSELMAKGDLKLKLQLPYPTGKHVDDACDWTDVDKHQSQVIASDEHSAMIKHTLDSTVYFIQLNWEGVATLQEVSKHYFQLVPQSKDLKVACKFLNTNPVDSKADVQEIFTASSQYWNHFWKEGGFVDFSKCTDERAKELERRVVLSQYLMAIQCAGSVPPQETGLTYNSWFGKFHLEMHWWHAAHFALWNRTDLLERSMDWYAQAYPVAKSIAQRQGFKGARWMKMTDPSGTEAPSKVGSFLIWQQPHFIYMAELIYRNKPTQEVLDKYKFLVEETAKFMASFATYDELEDRYVLKGAIPAQETLRASETVNPPFELSYWHYALSVAQQWREREGEPRNPQWDVLIDKLSPLAYNEDHLYLAAETAIDTYKDIRYTSDHMAVLGAVGILPQSKLVRPDYMTNTLNWVMKNWNWGKTWGWDYPMTAMCAARMGQPQTAVDAILMQNRTNTYLVNGHNFQDNRLRVYLPGNGGLLTTIAMMCAGWDGNEVKNPGFPNDGTWNVIWEDLKPMP